MKNLIFLLAALLIGCATVDKVEVKTNQIEKMNESVLIIGAGSGLSASLARLCASKNMTVVLAARNIDKLKGLKENVIVGRLIPAGTGRIASMYQEIANKRDLKQITERQNKGEDS